MRFSLISLIVFVLVSTCSECSKILGVFPVPAKSMSILGHALMKGLAENGHEVTFITCFPEKIPKDLKYKQVLLTGMYKDFQNNYQNLFEHVSSSLFRHMNFVSNWGLKLTRQAFEEENFKKLIQSNETFDVVIVEQFFVDSLKGLSWHYNAPLVLFSTLGANTWFNGLMGNPSPPSYIPEVISDLTDNMNILERFRNTVYRTFIDIVLHFSHYPKQNEILHEHFPDAPHLDEIIYNHSLALINSDISFNQPVPKVPNMIDIGGFHIKPAKEITDVNLAKYLNEIDQNGFIYFSLGSNVKSSCMPKETIEMLLRVFSKLQQKVLWKFEKELDNIPKNVRVEKWLPQQEILGHPKLKLFITHGGLLSTTETIYHGVPVLSIPVFADQSLNSARIVDKGFGLTISYLNLTNNEKYLEECLNELISNRRYSEKAKEISRIFHDKPMKPMETAIFWIEYVIRHKGAPYLRVSATKLNIFQYFLLDIVFGIIVIFFFLFYSMKFVLRKISKQQVKSKED